MEYSRNPKARASYIAGDNAKRLALALQALEQIQEVGFTYLLKDGLRSSQLTTLRHVSNFLGIPYATLHKHQAHLKSTSYGAKKDSFGTGVGPLLGSGGEEALEKHILWMDEHGFPMSWKKIKVVARDISKIHNVNDFVASSGWVKRFKKRHAELATRVAQSLERTRAGGMNPESISHYFDVLNKAKKELVDLNGGRELTPDLIYNLDETGIDQTSDMKERVVTFKTKQSPTYIQGSSDRTHLSAAVCIRGDGWRAKTMYALKGVRRQFENLPGCPEEVDYIMTEKGYFDEQGFEEYIKFLVSQLPPEDTERWKLLVLDGYGPHTMVPSVVDLLHEHSFHAVCMPSHTSQILQPLDVACFGPSKGEFKADLRDIQYEIGVDAVTKWELPAVFEFALEIGCSSKNIIAGFVSCGLIHQEQFDKPWVERNAHFFKISENLNVSRSQEKDSDVSNCSHGAARKAAEDAKAVLQQVLLNTAFDSPTKKVVHTALETLSSTVIPLAERYTSIMKSPPKNRRKRTRGDVEEEDGPSRNQIGESHAAAKWITEDARRAKLHAFAQDALQRAQDRESAKAERERKQQAVKEAKNAAQVAKAAVRELLRRHNALQPQEVMNKKHLIKFYKNNKQKIDNIISQPFPTKITEIIECLFMHDDALVAM